MIFSPIVFRLSSTSRLQWERERTRQREKEAATVKVREYNMGEVDNPEQSVECGRPSRGDQRRGGVWEGLREDTGSLSMAEDETHLWSVIMCVDSRKQVY